MLKAILQTNNSFFILIFNIFYLLIATLLLIIPLFKEELGNLPNISLDRGESNHFNKIKTLFVIV